MDLASIKVASFIAIIATGILVGRSGKLGKGTGEAISKIVFNFTLPASIIHAFGSADLNPQLFALIPLGVCCTLGPYLLTLALTRKTPRPDRALYLMNTSGFNIGSFGLPFVQAFFPASTIVAACMFDAGNALMMTGGTFALTRIFMSDEPIAHPIRMVLRRLAASAPFDSYLILIGLAALGVQVPGALILFTEPIANANSFLSMFMLGLMVNFSLDRTQAHKLCKLVTGRLILSAFMSLLVFLFLPLGFEVRLIITVLLWTPIGSMGPVFTLWAGGDHGLAGLANAISIFMSIAIMTCIILFYGVVL